VNNLHLIPEPIKSYLNFIPEPDRYISSLFRPLPSYLRINTLKISIKKAKELLRKYNIELAPVGISGLKTFFKVSTKEQLGNLAPYYMGFFYPQALSSAFPVLALSPRYNEFILDLCAAPGGKTGFIAQIMGDTGLIVANDRKISRLTALTANLKRLGVTNTVVTFYRGENFPLFTHFDKILLDAPCSGEGKYRISEDGKIYFRKQGNTNLPAIQKGLILRAFDLLSPGGTLVYSTCTINPEENEAVITHLLKKRNAQIISWEVPKEVTAFEGITEFKGKEYDSRCKRCRRFYPHFINSVGFFVAKVVKPK